MHRQENRRRSPPGRRVNAPGWRASFEDVFALQPVERIQVLHTHSSDVAEGMREPEPVCTEGSRGTGGSVSVFAGPELAQYSILRTQTAVRPRRITAEAHAEVHPSVRTT